MMGMAHPLPDNECSQSEIDDDGPSRRRQREYYASSTAAILSAYGMVVVFVLTNANVNIKHFNALKLTAALEASGPGGVVTIRSNYWLNHPAVDTRSSETSSTLLNITKLLGVNVRAYEPRMSNLVTPL